MNIDDIPSVLKIERDNHLSPWSFSGYQDEMERSDSLLIVAEKDHHVVGFACARLITPKAANGEAEILNIAVSQEFQQKGIGKTLLQKIFKAAKANEITQVWLEVRESNTGAQKFYRSNGFKIAGKRKNFYRNPPEDALLMKACI